VGEGAVAEGLAPSVAEGLAPSVAEGLAPSVTEGLAPSVAEGLAPSVAEGLAPSVAEGLAPSVAEGLAPSVAEGLAPSVAEGPALSEVEGLVVVTTASVGEEASRTIESLKSKRVRAKVNSRTMPMTNPAHGNNRLRGRWGVTIGVGTDPKIAGGPLSLACTLPR
jgi:hypothetical protein